VHILATRESTKKKVASFVVLDLGNLVFPSPLVADFEDLYVPRPSK
jgi:hypothetical protein